MEDNSIKMSPVLTPDEKILDDFIKTRMKKTLSDINSLSEEGSTDLMKWSAAFTYLISTYGRDSDEPFKWFKYYLKEGKIPAEVAMPLLIQIYIDGSVDKGFANTMARIYRNEPEEVKNRRVMEMKDDLGKLVTADGKVVVYRGAFSRPFGIHQDESTPIEKAVTFTSDAETAKNYACCWYPEKAYLYEALVPLEEVLWYGAFSEDKTVIVLPQFKGGSIEIKNVTEIPENEYDNKIDRKQAMAAYAR